MPNNYTGRIWQITGDDTTPFGTANVKFKGGTWTGMSSNAVFTITDVAGRQYSWQATADGSAIDFYELGWLSGPLSFSFTGTTNGEVNLFLGTK